MAIFRIPHMRKNRHFQPGFIWDLKWDIVLVPQKTAFYENKLTVCDVSYAINAGSLMESSALALALALGVSNQVCQSNKLVYRK